MEANNVAVAKKGEDEAVVVIPGSEDGSNESDTSSKNLQLGLSPNPNPELKEVKNVALKVQVPNSNRSSFAQGSTEPSHTPSGKPPVIATGTLARRKSSLTRSAYSNLKSRLVEESYPNKTELAEVKSQLKSTSSPSGNSPIVASPGTHVGSAPPKGNVKRLQPLQGHHFLLCQGEEMTKTKTTRRSTRLLIQ